MNGTAAYLASMLAFFQNRFESKDRGATAVEYGLLVGLIAVAIIGVLVVLGPQLAGLFERVSTQLAGVTPAP